MSETKKSLKVTDKNVDSHAKRGILSILTDETGEQKEKMIYPLSGREEESFYQDLKNLKADYLPKIDGFINGGEHRFALCEVSEGEILADCREKINQKNAIEMMKDLADIMEETHEEGFAYDGLSARDILVNQDGMILPPPARPADDAEIANDFASVGGILYELLTGVEYRPGMSISPDTVPQTVPYGVKRVICNATSKDASRHFASARDLIRAFDSRKVESHRNQPVPAPQPTKEETQVHREEIQPVREEPKPPKQEVKTADREEDEEKIMDEVPEKTADGKKGLWIVMTIAGVAAAIVAIVMLVQLLGGGETSVGYNSLVQSAAAAVAEGRYDEVEQYTASAIEKDPDRLAAYYYEALSLYKAEDYQATIDYMEENIMGSKFELKENEQDIQKNIYYILGNSYFMVGNYENAYKKLTSAQSKGYDAAAVGRMLALASVRMNNQAALDAVMSAETMGDAGAAYAEGVSLASAGDMAAAAVKFSEAAGILGDNSEITAFCLLRTVDCFIQAADYDSAIGACNTSLARTSSEVLKQKLTLKKAVAQMDKAKTTNDLDSYKEAMATFSEVVEMGYQVNMAKYEIGECNLWIGERDAAKAVLEEVAASGDETYAAKATSLMELNGLIEASTEE